MKIIKTHLWFFVILVIGLGIRLYSINIPLLDTKPHREIHTAEETRNLYYDKELLYPKTKLWADEPGYYIVEFPIYNAIVASLYQLTGSVNETLGRLVSVGSSVGVAVFFYLFVQRYFGKQQAVWSLVFFYLFSPQEIIMSRSFQPDQLGFLFGICALYYFSKWIDEENLYQYIFSWCAFAITLLIKVSFFPFAFPMIYLAWKKWKSSSFIKPSLLVYLLTALPFVVWFTHLKTVYAQFPHLHSAPLVSANSWLELKKLVDIRWYVNVFYDFVDQITTLPVFIVFICSFFITQRKNYGLLFAWIAGLILYAIAFVGKFHFWYYQVPFLFPIAILAGHTVIIISDSLKKVFVYKSPLFIVLLFLLMGLTARPYLLRTYTISNRNAPIEEIGAIIKEKAKPNSKILTSADTHAALTYYSLRPDMWGGTLQINETNCPGTCTIDKFEGFRTWGATLYALSNKQEFTAHPVFEDYIRKNYAVLKETDTYIVFDITRKL